MSLRSQFLTFDDRLARSGVPPLTTWWRDGIGRWLDAYESGHVLELFACVGRGAAKSTALYKLALFFTLFGNFVVPPGERHFAVVLSRLKEEAAKGIAIIAAWLRILAVPHHVAGDVIELDGQPRGVRVVAASVAASSGWRAFLVGKDERSKWPMGGVEDAEASEIDTSAGAMTATHPLSPVLSFGSAWGDFGEFYNAITAGSDAARVVLGPAPTWIAAPHIREEDCRKKERDPRRFAREYACVFQAGASSALNADQVARAIGAEAPTDFAQCARVILLDPTAGASDTYAFASCGWRLPTVRSKYLTEKHWSTLLHVWEDAIVEDDSGKPVVNPEWREEDAIPKLVFDFVDGFSQGAKRGITSDQIVAMVVKSARHWGAVAIHSDQFERYALASAIGKYGITFRPHSWTAPLKERAVERVRQWLRDDMLCLPKHDKLRSELLSFEERIAPSGALTFRGRSGGHDDFAMLVMLAALVDIEGGLPGSPIHRGARYAFSSLDPV